MTTIYIEYDETRDNIILLKDNKIFYPIFVINKQNLDEECNN